jgi:hypothetical protein
MHWLKLDRCLTGRSWFVEPGAVPVRPVDGGMRQDEVVKRKERQGDADERRCVLRAT